MSEESVVSRMNHNSVRFVLVSNAEQLQHAMTIRAICYMEEQGVPAKQAIDANDFYATHMLIYVADEPVGSIRVRWFKDFAKFERMAIRKAYRNPRLIRDFSTFVFGHIARKGYDTAITHAKPEYARLWQKLLRFEVVEGKKPLHFRGHGDAYVELVKRLTVPDNAIGPDSDIATLFRTEGEWDQKSEFEHEQDTRT